MRRRLSIGLLASAIGMAPLPTKAEDGTAEDLGDVMSISLKDVVKPNIGFQGALQGAGTPNQAGIGGFVHWLLVRTVFGLSMYWSTPTSGTEAATAALATPW